MDWLDATTAVLAIIAIPLALRYPLHRNDDASSCDCAAADRRRTIPQEEEPPQERQADTRADAR